MCGLFGLLLAMHLQAPAPEPWQLHTAEPRIDISISGPIVTTGDAIGLSLVGLTTTGGLEEPPLAPGASPRCPVCAREFPDNVKFCPNCGTADCATPGC